MIRELDLNEKQIQIKRWIDRLDEVAISYESKWGIGRLNKIITDELAIKWDAQNKRLRDAIESQDLNRIADLVEGTIRGWAALENEAIKNGHKPNDNEFWETTFEESEFTYRIYKNETEKRAAGQSDGVVCYSLKELARILDNYQLVNKIKETIGGKVIGIEQAPLELDKTKKYTVEDDEIPF
jgi:hypothetical protein